MLSRTLKLTCCGQPLVLRPARSKHCRMCNHCVLRFDHHCVWVDNCIGEANIHLFIGFLALLSFLLLYGSVVLIQIWVQKVTDLSLFTATFYDGSGNPLESSLYVVFLVSLFLLLYRLAWVRFRVFFQLSFCFSSFLFPFVLFFFCSSLPPSISNTLVYS